MAYPFSNINGTDLPLELFQGPMRDRERDESTYRIQRAGSKRKGALRLWLFWEWTFVGTDEEWNGVRNLLQGDATGEFEFSPRGINTFRCRCTSELPNLTPRYMRNGKNEMIYRVNVRVEAVAPVSERPPVYLPANRILLDVDNNFLTDADGNVLLG